MKYPVTFILLISGCSECRTAKCVAKSKKTTINPDLSNFLDESHHVPETHFDPKTSKKKSKFLHPSIKYGSSSRCSVCSLDPASKEECFKNHSNIEMSPRKRPRGEGQNSLGCASHPSSPSLSDTFFMQKRIPVQESFTKDRLRSLSARPVEFQPFLAELGKQGSTREEIEKDTELSAHTTPIHKTCRVFCPWSHS